jgi:hypothetical protein
MRAERVRQARKRHFLTGVERTKKGLELRLIWVVGNVT